MSTDNPYKTEHHCIGLIGIPAQSIGGYREYCTFAVQSRWQQAQLTGRAALTHRLSMGRECWSGQSDQ